MRIFGPLFFCATLLQGQITYRTIGGSAHDVINAAAVDDAGNIWVAGTTSSFDFPIRGGPR